MEAVYYTITAVALYFISDWLLQRIEIAAGRRFDQRTLIFFAILLSLALISFAGIRSIIAP
jgi:hypothetical protein